MNASFFKSFEGSRLRRRKAGFQAAFGKNPPAPAGLNQQKFNAAFADAVTNRSYLLASWRKP